MKKVLGIDIGGTGIKGAIVNLKRGKFATDRLRIPTPSHSTPENVAKVLAEIVDHFSDELGDAPVGITVPAPVVHGVTPFIANLEKSWAGKNMQDFFSDTLGRKVVVVNDADAAGVAEVYYGAAQGVEGTVLVTTLGTGIGSALIYKGVLIPNTEFGHIELDGAEAEKVAAKSIMVAEDLSFEEWAKRLQRYYSHLEMLLCPDLMVVGGGISKNSDQFLPLLDLKCDIVPAKLKNKAGIIGAAWLADNAV